MSTPETVTELAEYWERRARETREIFPAAIMGEADRQWLDEHATIYERTAAALRRMEATEGK